MSMFGQNTSPWQEFPPRDESQQAWAPPGSQEAANYQQAGQNSYYPNAEEVPQPKVSKGKRITGIVMTVLGALFLLGGIASGQNGMAQLDGRGPAYMAGYLSVPVLALIILIVGIVLIRKSKPRN